MDGFQKCTNGHYYPKSKSVCPYCPSANKVSGGSVEDGEKPTEDFSGGGMDEKTQVYTGFTDTNAGEGQDKTSPHAPPRSKLNIPDSGNKTIFVDSIETEDGTYQGIRSTRRLVGWLVTYTADPMGIDFKLYEGRNTIGRDVSCNITVNDGTITGKHSTILFRNGKYKIKDEMSTHGTFVNDNDIEDEQYDLNDGDMIKLGQTVFKFRTAF